MSRVAEFMKTLTGERRLPKSFRSTLQKYGDKKIVGIEINRDPLSKGATLFADLVSAGTFSQAQKKLGIEKFFHLYALLILEDDTQLLYEKNQSVVLYPWHGTKNKENENIFQGVDGIPLAEFVQKHIDRMGMDKYLTYDPLSLNCQNFILNALKANGLANHTNEEFVYQPLDQLVEEVPSFSKWLAKKVTDTAAAVSDPYEELVYRRGGVLRRQHHVYRRVGMF